jgi:hypothetical protein
MVLAVAIHTIPVRSALFEQHCSQTDTVLTQMLIALF